MADDDLDPIEEPSTEPSDGTGNAAKVLRQQASKLAKEKAVLETEVATLRAESRRRTIVDLLTDADIDPKRARALADYAANDVDGEPDAAAIQKWIAAKGDVFGITPLTQENPAEVDAIAEPARRVTRTTSTAPEAEALPNWTSDKVRTSSDADLIAAGIIPARDNGGIRNRR